MGRLSVKVQELRECVAKLLNQATEVEDIFFRSKNIHAQISEVWDGAASEAYLDALAKQVQELKDIDNVIRQYATAMNSVARELEEQDRREEERIRALQMLTMGGTVPGAAGGIGQAVGQAIGNALSGGSGKAGTASTTQSSNLGASLGAIGGVLGTNQKKKK